MPKPIRRESEAERIARVYRDYRVSGRGRLYDSANRGYRKILDERQRSTLRLLEAAGLSDLHGRTVLDVGCGGGSELARMAELGASATDLVGVDLLPERIEAARRSYPGIEFRTADAAQLDLPSGSFDLVLSFTVFSSILDPGTEQRVASEMTRVLKPGGAVLWYDLRVGNPNNRNVRGLPPSEVRALFPELRPYLRRITLAPPLARRLGRLAPLAYPALSALPVLRSHLLGLLVKADRH